VKKFVLAKKFNNLNIGSKLLLSYIVVVFIPVLLVGVLLITNMRQMAIEHATREASVNIERSGNRFNEVLRLVMDISYKLQMDKNLETLLLTTYKSNDEVFESYYQYNEFNNYINIYSREVKDIKIYSDNKSLLDSGQFIKTTPEITNSKWYKKILSANGRIYWQYLYDNQKNKNYLCITRLIKSISSNKTLGALVISINSDFLNSLVSREPYDIYFIDDLENIFSARDKSLMGQKVKLSAISDVENMNDGIWDVSYQGKPAKAIVKNFSPSVYNGNFRIVSIVPISSLEKKAYETAVLGIIIMASSLLVALLLILIFTSAISKRVKRLSMDMHKVAMGNFDFKPTIVGEDEIGQLSNDLEIMAKSIKELVHEVYEINMQKNQLAIKQREIKLKMLANQINPHFLFNSLETIRMKAHLNGDEEIAEITKLLGKLMRKNLEIGNEIVTIESEIELVKSYLDIQIFRYGDRINYEINYESEDIKAYKILPLIIQPIVENSIVHGLESKQGGGNVKINLAWKHSNLVITVEDNGGGISAEKLDDILVSFDQLEETPGKHVGLKNVHQRIKLFYGENFGLRIYSGTGVGTKIEMYLPGGGG
jgi:two-component system sensor histidine kinase YesM